jgi:hypothetical protein
VCVCVCVCVCLGVDGCHPSRSRRVSVNPSCAAYSEGHDASDGECGPRRVLPRPVDHCPLGHHTDSRTGFNHTSGSIRSKYTRVTGCSATCCSRGCSVGPTQALAVPRSGAISRWAASTFPCCYAYVSRCFPEWCTSRQVCTACVPLRAANWPLECSSS